MPEDEGKEDEAQDTSEEEEPSTKPAEVLDVKEEQGSQVPPQLQILKQYLPEREDYAGKTRLNDRKQPSTLASVGILCRLYPEIDDLEEILGDWQDDLEKYLTSLDGKSRKEFREILKALLGVYSKQNKEDLDTDTNSQFKKMFSSYAGMNKSEE